MTGYAAQRETAQMALRHEQALRELFPASIVEAALSMDRAYEPPPACLPEARVQILTGGVYQALWILSRKLQTGLCADLLKIPIRQETVEICEVLDRDPYTLDAGGAWLIAVKDGEKAAWLCKSAQIPSAVIGETCRGTAAIVTCGETIRYLERP